MSNEEKILLNLVFFDNRFRELELKQWWLAVEIGVDRKTVGRWLTGQTKRIRKDNLKKLSEILECIEEDLILKDEASQFASASEQKEAAKLIEQDNLLEILTPTGKWPLLAGLIKASMEPNLPVSLLGQLYNFLCICAWRQSDLDKAELYLKKAIEVTRKTEHKSVIARTKLNEATLASFRGNNDQAIEGYLYCVDNKKYLEDEGVYASALSNLGCVYQESGDLAKSIEFQLRAINEFIEQAKPLNLSIAYIGLCDAYLEKKELDKAWQACEQSLENVKLSQMQRGYGDCYLFFSLILSAKEKYQEAYDHYLKAKEKFQELDIDEGRTYRTGGVALAGLGKKDEALKLFNQGLKVSKPFPHEYKLIQKLIKDCK
tara:strand:+ start:145415 stop:146536 length:1122 start_codon:yes stop_codon:yes gene_type:complete